MANHAPNKYSPAIEKQRSKYPIANYVSTKKLPKPLKTFADEPSTTRVPVNIEEALTDPKWVHSIREEMGALQRNETWNLVPLPVGNKTVGCKWIFSFKYKADGTVDRYKARLGAKRQKVTHKLMKGTT